MVLVKEQRRLEALIEVLQKDLQVEKEETRQACVKPDETQKGKTESVSMYAMKPVVKMYARTTSYGKTAVKTVTATRTASSSSTRKIPKVKGVSQRPFIPLVDQRGTSKSGAKEACQEVRRDVRQGVRHKVLHHIAVTHKPKVVHQCINMKVRQEVLKHGCAAGTRKETDRCISNCVRPSKKQHQMVEEVSLAKSELLDEIKEETLEEGCSSGRSDLEVDQGASSLEPGHDVVCGTKGKEIEGRQEVMRDDLQEGDSEVIPRQ
ncbi:hypothetical protein F2Q68_00010631 [Brassica cretica]|uniref:Uncharacterized protein n=1 Tax=Brassica cretica TaxID=69181 RepID=A0A8S9KWV1_BRACR|nr:hypothetical protein F2Q68_00010631 [Brassica cretica]